MFQTLNICLSIGSEEYNRLEVSLIAHRKLMNKYPGDMTVGITLTVVLKFVNFVAKELLDDGIH